MIKRVLDYIIALLLKCVPGKTEVQLIPVLYTVKSLKKKTVGTILLAILKLLGINGKFLLKILPNVILNLPINVNNMAAALLSQVPAGTFAVPFPLFITLVRVYLEQILVISIVNLLNDIS